MRKTYILTGGPGAGKSTLLEELKLKGYNTIKEVATRVIKEQLDKKGNLLPWTDRDGFQKEVMKRQQRLEKKAGNTVTFLDRGLADGIAYYKLDNLKIPYELEQAAKQANYTKILLVEPLQDYKTTETRREDKEAAKKIHRLIEQTYKELGYEVIKIPPLPPKQRAYLVEKILGLK